ncbi:MAG: PIG-L deacetylase family protein [Geodermatophilaceae bacterium]
MGSADLEGRPGRLLGLFAHPDDKVFCNAGTIARCARASASTLGTTRSFEFSQAAQALGVGHATCLDLGDGTLARRSFGPDGALAIPTTSPAMVRAHWPGAWIWTVPADRYDLEDPAQNSVRYRSISQGLTTEW